MERSADGNKELSLSADAVEEIEAYSEQIRILGVVGDDVKIPLLLDCLLRRLVDDRRINAVLDVELAVSLMRERAIRATMEKQEADDVGSHRDAVHRTLTPTPTVSNLKFAVRLRF